MNLFLDANLETKQALLDSLGVATCLAEMHEEKLVVLAMNDLFRKFYGLSPNTRKLNIDVQCLSIASGTSTEVLEPTVHHMQSNAIKCIETQRPIYTESELPQPDGSIKWSRNTIAPVIQGDQVVYLLVSIIDITELVKTQRAIERNLTHLMGQHVSVCKQCKRVKGNGDEWLSLEKFMLSRGDLNFTHGICLNCKAEIMQ